MTRVRTHDLRERSSGGHHVLLNPTFRSVLSDPVPQGRIVLFIGFPGPGTEREIEILVHEFPGTGREAVVFHAMPLGPKFRRFREENG